MMDDETHQHTLVARAVETTLPMCNQWELGCHVCGPQWIITIDWQTQKARLGWINLPYLVTLNRGGALVEHHG